MLRSNLGVKLPSRARRGVRASYLAGARLAAYALIVMQPKGN